MPRVAPRLVPRLVAVAALAAAALALPAAPALRAAERLPVIGSAPGAASDTVVHYRLEDQFGRVHTPATYAGAPMFIVGADQGGRGPAREWALALTAELKAAGAAPRIAVVPVADLRRVPRLLRRLVRGRFPKGAGEQVLLDWEGTVARAHAFTADECTVLLVGPTGRLLRRTTTTAVDSALVREFARQAVELAQERSQP